MWAAARQPRAPRADFGPNLTRYSTNQIATLEFLDEVVGTLTDAIERQLLPFAPVLARLDTIPG